MANSCGQCLHYRMNRYLESICSKTGKNVGYLWNKECYEPIPLPSTQDVEEQTSDDNKLTPNANNMAENATTKVCKDCGRELPIESFQRQAKSKDGYMHICKECKQKRMQLAYKNSPEATAIADAVKPISLIGSATDKELVDELRARGWDVKCTRTIEL